MLLKYLDGPWGPITIVRISSLKQFIITSKKPCLKLLTALHCITVGTLTRKVLNQQFSYQCESYRNGDSNRPALKQTYSGTSLRLRAGDTVPSLAEINHELSAPLLSIKTKSLKHLNTQVHCSLMNNVMASHGIRR